MSMHAASPLIEFVRARMEYMLCMSETDGVPRGLQQRAAEAMVSKFNMVNNITLEDITNILNIMILFNIKYSCLFHLFQWATLHKGRTSMY